MAAMECCLIKEFFFPRGQPGHKFSTMDKTVGAHLRVRPDAGPVTLPVQSDTQARDDYPRLFL